MDAEAERRATLISRVRWHKVWPWLLGLAVLLAVVLGPYGALSWVAGFVNLALVWILLTLGGDVGWTALLVVASIRVVRKLRSRQKKRAALWLGVALGIVLAHVLSWMGKTPSPPALFGRGLLAYLEIRTDVDAIQTWFASLDPNDCLPVTPGESRGRYLGKEDLPEILKRQGGMVVLGLDVQDRPAVRLEWWQGKAGAFGVVIGHMDMKTPPSGPGRYDERRTELRGGIYFWYREA